LLNLEHLHYLGEDFRYFYIQIMIELCYLEMATQISSLFHLFAQLF